MIESKRAGGKIIMTQMLLQHAREIIRDMQRRIMYKIGIDDIPAPPNKPATVKKKGKDHRMIDTGLYVANAFPSPITRAVNSVVIYIRQSIHPGKKGRANATYQQIAKWNQKNHPEQNPEIDASLHFGISREMKKDLIDKIKSEIMEQAKRRIIYKAVVSQRGGYRG